MLVLSQRMVDGIDWGAIGVAGCLLLISLVGAFLALRYSSSSRRPVAREFNYLWRARLFTQVVSAGFALSTVLRLQLLWGPASVIQEGGYVPTTFCRIYIACTYGVFEPAVLLLALFACFYSLQGRESTRNPNTTIVAFSAFFSLPAAAAQIVAALFTRMFDLPYESKRLYARFFATYAQLPQHCSGGSSYFSGPPGVENPGDVVGPPPNCAFCVFPLLSTLVSASFAALYLLAFWIVTQRIVAAVINKALARRVRTLQVLTTAWTGLSLACRGCTVLFQPFDVAFEVLRVAHLVAMAGLALTLQYYLVLKPVWDSHLADRALKQMGKQQHQQFRIGGGCGSGSGLGLPLFPPTEMQLLDPSCSSASRRQQQQQLLLQPGHGEDCNRV